MSDPKSARALLDAADRPLATFTPYAVQFRYEGLGPGHEPIDRPTALARVEELARHVRDRLAEVG